MIPNVLAEDEAARAFDMNAIFKHALDHDHWLGTPFTTFTAMILIAGALIAMLGLATDKRSLIPRGFLRNTFESLMLFIRDQLVRPSMGGAHHGDRYVPFFCTIFVFIYVLNMLGLIPGCGSATSNLFVTGTLAVLVLIVSVASGLMMHGSHFIQLFVPSGLPKVLAPVLFVLEFVGFFIKHGVLMVRLFANMLAGHLVFGAFIGLIFLFQSYWVAGLLSVPLALFVSALELLVAFLQAYVFTLLAVLFVGGMVHPEH